ncbi:inorganic phosphate transporter [Tubulinosema ratisbonensis]|uniref:Inorganic phosphate transporter n=1 Tax=Tubulinosema ratisbonensis TaxID=291195 RepID=A0A437AK55_9MICR|nr:inorganic phosphate transporter [Tubulinosema ratisbonensis]
MQSLKKIPIMEGNVIWIIRGVFIASIALQAYLLFFIKRKISLTNDTRTVSVPKISGEEEGNEDITFSEYDKRECDKLIKGIAIQLAITLFIHVKWNVIQPLIIQAITPIKSFFLKPLYCIYLRNFDMIRPYENNLLFSKTAEKKEETKEEEKEIKKKKKKED